MISILQITTHQIENDVRHPDYETEPCAEHNYDRQPSDSDATLGQQRHNVPKENTHQKLWK